MFVFWVGSLQDNTTLTITGSNLNSDGGTSSVVKIGDSDCQITSSSEASITCKVVCILSHTDILTIMQLRSFCRYQLLLLEHMKFLSMLVAKDLLE